MYVTSPGFRAPLGGTSELGDLGHQARQYLVQLHTEQEMGIGLEGHELLLGSDQSVEDQLHIREREDAIARRGDDHHRATNAAVSHPRGICGEDVSQEAEGVTTEK